MPWWSWSQTSSANATTDPSINWSEGQAPSSVNDSARAMMSATAKYRDDISGAILTGGTSTVYTVASNSVFDTLAHLHNQIIAFTPHTTNGATVTLNVDSLGAKPLRSAPSTELQAGTIVEGTPYVAIYNNTDGVFYLQGFFGNPYNIPLAAGLDFWGPTAPNTSFAFPAGQAISRTTYANLFALVGTDYGTGDGSTTFNLPDKTGRVSAMIEATATRLTSSFFGSDSTTLGSAGGLDHHTLTTSEIPIITSVNSAAVSLSVTSTQKVVNGVTVGSAQAGGSQVTAESAANGGALSTVGSTGTIAIGQIGVTSQTTGGAHAIVQPTIICNYIMRII